LVLLFADTMIEDQDLYRFLDEGADAIGGELIKIADGRTIWELFKDEGFVGNTRVDICSRVLKRDLLNNWRKEHCDPETTITHFGIDWSESHRFTRLIDRHAPWQVSAPLCEPPFLTKADQLAQLDEYGIAPPRLYELGAPHNNCGGGCVKAGMAHWRWLLRALPEVYAEWERNEQEMRDHLGRQDIAILRDRRGGVSTPITLRELRERIEREQCGQPVLFGELAEEWGGCGCAVE